MPLEAVSAINYVDDGRFLVVELVHGLAVLECIAECNIFACTRGQVDIFGRHIVVEIVTEKYGALTSKALEQP